MTRSDTWRLARALRGARPLIAAWALTVSGAFPSGSMVTAACPVTGSLSTWSVLSFLVCRRYQARSVCEWVVGYGEAERKDEAKMLEQSVGQFAQ
jgi:hypothetical protein